MARPIRIVGHGVKPADQFQAHPNNPRKHPQRQRAAVAESIARLGWYDVVIENVRTGHLIDGHERIWQALEAGDDVPFIQVDLSEEEERLALASHDWLSSLAEYDKGMLDDLLHQIDDGGKLLEEMAADFRIEDLLPVKDEDPGPQLDRAEELREKWQTARGQVWQVGEHRVMCGDSTSDLNTLLEGAEIDLLLTDPPYGIAVVSGTGSTDGGAKPVTIGTIRARRPYPFGGVKNRGTIGATNMVDATLYRPVYGDEKTFDPAPLLNVGKQQIIFGGNYFASKLPDKRCWLVWDKNNTGNFADAELAWTSFDTGVRLYQWTWNGLVRQGSRDIEGVKRIHPTQKPAGLMALILGDFSEMGDRIVDLYLGSGTTLVACQQTGRRGYGMEIDPAYVAVTLERLAGMGLEPRLVD